VGVSALLDDPSPAWSGHPIAGAVARIGGCLAEAAEACLWSLSDRELPDVLEAAGTALAQLQGLLVSLVGEVDARELAAKVGASGTAALARQRLALTPADAAELTAVARATRRELSAAGQALAAGQVSYRQAAAIVRAVGNLPDEVGPEVRRRAEAHLIGEAARFDPAELARLGRHILEVVAADAWERIEAERLARDEERAARRREFTMIDDGHGLHWLRGRLDTEAAAVLRAALDPLSAPAPAGEHGADLRTGPQRRADALVELARRALIGDQLPDNGGQRPQVVVTVPLRTLTERLGHATVDDGGILSPTAARILACDCQLIPAVLGSTGQVLDLGQSQRLFTGSLRRALALRDGGCSFPGCDRPAAWCDGHHIVSWADGGTSSLDNGVLLCGHHHAVVHRDGWTIQIAADGIPEFTPPAWIDPTATPRRNHRHRSRAP